MDWSIAQDRTFLRIDTRGLKGPPPERLTTRLTRFGAMRVTALGIHGGEAFRDTTERDMIPGTADWVMSVDLPKLSEPVEAIALTVDKARHEGIVANARLTTIAQSHGGPFTSELALAALCGMLCMPLLFNFAFYRVLRARFLVWHTAAVAFMLVQTFVTSGIVNRYFSLDILSLSIFSAFSFGGGISAAMLFAADFIEPGKLKAVHRSILRWSWPWVMGWTAFYVFADGPLRPYCTASYYLSFVPVLGLFTWVMVVAKRQQSRAVNFLIAAWAPFMITGALRVSSALGMTSVPLELQPEQHLSIAWEIILNTLGVADRLLSIRRDRDRAREQALALEAMAERDPLTGLLNRRGITERFERLYEAGYHAMAVIDLDNFKLINDTYGHAMGDKVLRVVAGALTDDDEIVAVRMGGEEFLLLLSGDNLASRAERCRQAIPARVASLVPGLDRIVTASMGFIEQPEETMRADFATLYAQCDRLLYEAKAAGRNRAMSERIRSFSNQRQKAQA